MKHYKLQNYSTSTQLHVRVVCNEIHKPITASAHARSDTYSQILNISEMETCIGIKPSGMESALVGLCGDACAYYLR